MPAALWILVTGSILFVRRTQIETLPLLIVAMQIHFLH